ncbi:DUF393 domain-containing protein [Parvularcula sp. LCG005]|uniref:thiol-disulfide oxidoreductase DCC family protein n=1 Tax=Parvularcula sp. LCG005 TaxID=3078805 RepID=UPI0029420B1C|nr:DUF393 domain-containing protein [Parvularcula sp. LCG005]WOI53364.1 DUF393 domain-containing protein [Parvularcula sp. LCG005]
MMTNAVTVYFDGACPLCRKEIALLRRMEKGRGRLVFEDVAPPDATPSCAIDRQRLLARFHVRLPDGEMVEGARAFTEAWSRVRGLGWLAPVGRFAPTRRLLDGVYAVFLKVRPTLQRLAA